MKALAPLLMLLLGSEAFAVRESATVALVRLDNALDLREALLPCLESADLEVRVRVRRILDAYEDVTPAAGYYPRFEFVGGVWTGTWWQIREDFGIEDGWLDAEGWKSEESLYWEDQCRRRACRAYAHALFQNGWTREEVLRELETAVRRERRAGRVPVPPPDEL